MSVLIITDFSAMLGFPQVIKDPLLFFLLVSVSDPYSVGPTRWWYHRVEEGEGRGVVPPCGGGERGGATVMRKREEGRVVVPPCGGGGRGVLPP